MRAYVLSSNLELETIKHQWGSLYLTSVSENPFLSWEWTRLWLAVSTDNVKIRVVVIEEESEIICIAPFSIKDKDLLFLSDSLFSDYMDVLATKHSAEIFELIVETITKDNDWNRADLLTIPGSSKFIEHYQRTLSEKTLYSSIEVCHLNPYVQIIGDFDDFIKSKSKGFRQDLRTTQNKLDKGADEWEFVEAKTQNEKTVILSALIELHLQRQQGKVGTSIFEDIANIDFYKNLIHNQDLPWSLHLSGIRVANRFVSASISIIANNIFYYWIPAFDVSLRSGSIGQLHVKYLIDKCFKENFDRFDFMGGSEAYKLRWTDQKYKNYRVLAYRNRRKLYEDRAWAFVRQKLQKLKNGSPFWNRVWIQVSKLVGK